MCLFIMFVIGSAAVAAKRFLGKHALKIIGSVLGLLLLSYLVHVVLF